VIFKGRFLTIPNMLTLLRLAILPFILYLIDRDLHGNLKTIFILLLIQGITDALDGFLARRLNQVSTWGKILDPVADKLTFDLIMIALVKYGFPMMIAALFVVRDFVIAVLALFVILKYETIPKPNVLGKFNTFLIVFFILVFLIAPVEAYKLFYVPVLAALVMSGIIYYARWRKFVKAQNDKDEE